MTGKRWLMIALQGAYLSVIFAQQAQTDSLYQVVQQAATNTAKLAAWQQLLAYCSRNTPEKTFGFVQQAIKDAGNQKDSATIASFIRFNGIAHATMGNRDSSVFYYFKAIEILERNGGQKELAALYNDVGRFFRREAPDRAISYYDKALSLYRSMNDEAGMSVIWNESGVAFENKKDYQEAALRYKKSMEIAMRLKDTVSISYSLSFLSGLKATQQRYQEAEDLALQTLKLREAMKDSFALAIALTNLGELYNLMGSYPQAITFFSRSNDIASRISFTDIMAHNYGQLTMAYQKSGDYKLALHAQQQQMNLNDSMFQLAKAKQIEEITGKYETVEKEKKIQQQAFELSRKNYLIALSLALLGLGGMGAAWYVKRRQYKHRQEMEVQKRTQQEKAAQEVMKAEESERRRIAAELHDGVGQLMSAARMNLDVVVNELIPLLPEKKERLERIVSLVDESCKEVRAVSHSMMPNALLKKGLSSALYDFIQKIDQQVINVQLHVEGLQERLPAEKESVLYRIIQEGVHNVIKHSGANQLDIAVRREESEVSITIEDNGKGFDVHQTATGIGLQNIAARVKFLQGTLDIDSTPGRGTFLGINIPL